MRFRPQLGSVRSAWCLSCLALSIAGAHAEVSNERTSAAAKRLPVPQSRIGSGLGISGRAAPVAAISRPTPSAAAKSGSNKDLPSAANGTKPKVQVSELVNNTDKIRMTKAANLRHLGYGVDWHQYSASALTEMEAKAQTANRIRQMGYAQDWKALSLSELTDRERRIEKAAALRGKGVNVDWQKSSVSQLVDVETRVEIANRLAKSGKFVKWQDYSTSQLSAMETERAREQ